MGKRIALAALLLAVPGLARAQTGPESVLPAKSQLYFRWDGAKAHREQFDKTGLGQTLRGDTGKFLGELYTYAVENIAQAVNQQDPMAGEILKNVGLAFKGVAQSGLVLGVELDRINPPKAQAVLVLPGAASESGTLLPLIQKAAELGRAEVKDTKIGRRFIHAIEVEGAKGLFLGWWNEGDDAVITIGTEEPAEYAKAADAKKTGLAKHALFKKVQGFKEFTTGSRGFIDVKGLLGAVEDVAPQAAKVVDALGLKGMDSITFYSGYDGPAFRDVVEVDMPGPRTGLLALSSTKKFSLKDLPPMPSDATSFSAGTIDVGKTYDVLYQLVETGLQIFAPDQVDNVKGTLTAIEKALGISFRDDLFGCFGDLAVTYSSPAEGPLSLGGTTLLQVKNGKKLLETIETIVKNVPNQQGFELNLKKKKYRDVEIYDLYFKADVSNNRLGSFAVYKDWFIFSGYPQGVKGFVLRSGGELPSWKASPELTKALAPFPKEFVSVSVSDPRPTVQFLLSITPFVVDIVNSLGQFFPNLRPFDLDLIPHAQEATRHLFPSVTISTDNGKMLRSETRSSLGLP
jgi:hypothetical protein